MMEFLAQATGAPENNLWNAVPGSAALWMKIGLVLLLGIVLMVLFCFAPTRLRRPIVVFFTFFAGLFYMAQMLWPQYPDTVKPEQVPGTVGAVSFWLKDAIQVVTPTANILTVFLLGLGIYSVLSVHGKRLVKQQKDWAFSGLLLLSMVAMLVFGYWDWIQNLDPAVALKLAENPSFVGRTKDLLFDGLLQVMDAAMFSLIAFFIFSAAYRAFRIRSVESTILLGTAFIMMISLMGAIVVPWNNFVQDSLGHGNPGAWINWLRLTDISGWLSDTIQTPAIRAVNFGVGIGALAMGLRIWLSLERGGVSTS